VISTDVLWQSGTSRVLKISKGHKQLTTPAYFPAISGVYGKFRVDQLVTLVVSSRYPRILFSAYDIYKMSPAKRKSIVAEVSEYFRNGSFVMLDSGIFERYWKRDAGWDFRKYAKSINKIDSDFYFSFDQLPQEAASTERFVKQTIRRIESSAAISESSQLIPIVHGPTPKQLLQIFGGLQKFLTSAPIIAIRERDCGSTISQRANTITQLRKRMMKQRVNSVLHLLGCGDPIALAVYSYCGADTFDSLDWTELAVNRRTLELVNLSQLELLNCNCLVCSRRIKDPTKRVLLHNLRFYQDYCAMLRTRIQRGKLSEFLISHVGRAFLDRLNRETR
jgi:queuine/archaeosine tRNA-ribosyltransferase